MWNLGAKLWDNTPPPTEAEPSNVQTQEDPEKTTTPHTVTAGIDTDTDNDSLNKDVQDGVHRVEAVTSVWSIRTLIIAYIL